jgi:hypothetical protein
MHKGVIGVVAALSMVTMAVAQKTPSGTATGVLKVGASKFTLNRAYALMEDDVENNRSNGPQKHLKIVLTDAALTQEDVSDWFRMAQVARTGKMHGVRLEYDPAIKELFGATIYYIPPSGQGSPTNITLSGKGVNHQIKDLKIADGWVSGTALMVKPDKWLEFEESNPPKNFTYRITFRAPIWKPEPVTANLTGKEARESPQVAAVVALFTAAHAGDITAVRRHSMPNPALEEFIKTEGEEKAKEMMKQSTPDPKTFPSEVQKVIVRGKTATVIAVDAQKITSRLKLILDGQDWKITP